VSGQSNAHGVQPGSDDEGNVGMLGQNEREWSGAEVLQQATCRRGHLGRNCRNLCQRGKMNDERIVRRSAFCFKDGLDRLRLEDIGAESVDRFGGECHQLTTAEE